MGRAPCCSKNSDLNRGAWTAQEDLILSQYIKTHGEGRWRSIPQKAGLKRCGKSCRLRWLNYLRPDIKRGDISPDEEDLIVRLHGLLGNRWSLIAGRLPSRTDNEIKNFWNTYLRKKCQLSVPEKEGSRKLKAAPPADDQHVFKSTPVKATAVRIKKGYRKYGSTSSDDGTSMEKNVIKSSQSSSMEIDGHYSPCYSYKPTSSSVDYQIPHSYEPCEDSGVNTFQSLLSMDELSSPDFDACTTTDITQLLDHDNTQLVNSFIASDDQANREMQEKEDWVEEEKEDWVEELQHQQKSSLQWLSLLLLESEEDWEEKNNRESVSVI